VVSGKLWSWIVLAGLILPAIGSLGHAQPVCDPDNPPWVEAVRAAEMEPASLLLFPFYDARPGGSLTIHTITNINWNRLKAENDFLAGDVLLHFFYVDGADCLHFDRFEFLTPGDTLSVIAGDHNPEGNFGYLIVKAMDPETELPVDFDFLVGDQLVVDARGNFVWNLPPIAFRALADERLDGAAARSVTGYAFTDLPINDGDNDGKADFNGYEYAYFPDQLILSSFFETNARSDTELVLLTPLDPMARVTVNFWIFNNTETRFSRSFQFSCFWAGSLADISNIVSNLEGDPGELPLPGVQTGWAVIDGRRAWLGDNILTDDAPIIGFAIQKFSGGGRQVGTARLLHHVGTQCGDDL
jgi:hypothetical protein